MAQFEPDRHVARADKVPQGDARQPAPFAHDAVPDRVNLVMDGVTQAGTSPDLPLRMRGHPGDHAQRRDQPGTKQATHARVQDADRKSLQLSVLDCVTSPLPLAL